MASTGGHERIAAILAGETALGLSPAELLDRFAASRDEAAFAAIVSQHGPMVLATCRRLLGNRADADDAFQATFLVLARRVGAIQHPERLAPWLHSIAHRVSVRARSGAARRRQVEGEGHDEAAVADPPDDAFELRAVLDEELARLPEKYRVPLVLCYLEGMTHDEAAGQLAWPVGTVRSRLAGGRDRLRSRLARRGFDPSTSLVPPSWPLAIVSRPLQASTLRLALAATSKTVATSTAALMAQGVLTSMFLAKIQTTLAAIATTITLAAAATGVVIAQRSDQALARGPAVAVAPDEPPPRPSPKVPPPLAPVPETSPLTVSGRALDRDGKPVAGARIYLASCAYDDNRRLAETRTDAEGFYRFQEVPLPIRPDLFPDPGKRIEGVFQVFGQADGFGFAWATAKRVRFAALDLPPNTMLNPTDFVKPGEPVALDLTFPPPAPLSGRVTDDKGRPLADARVWLRACTRPRLEKPILVDEIDSFRGSDTVPPEMNRRRTDADGRFTFDDLPLDHWFEFDIRPRGFPSRQVTATMTPVPELWNNREILTGPLDLVFITPREVAFRVVAADTGQPLEKAFFSTAGAFSLTDAEGRCKLPVAPGETIYSALPRFTTPYLETRGSLTIPADGPIAPIEIAVRPACTLEVTVTDAETGQPIADVDLWEDAPTSADPSTKRKRLAIRSFEAPRLVHSDSPRTDDAGKLRTFAEPGPRRVGVGLVTRTDGWIAVAPDGQAIDGKPGETLRLTFTMRRPSGSPRLDP